MKEKLSKLVSEFSNLIESHQISSDLEIETISSLSFPKKNSLCYATELKFVETAINTDCNGVILPVSSKDSVSKDYKNKNIIFSYVPEVLAAKISLKYLFDDPRSNRSPFIHQTAIVDSSAKISKSSYIEPYAVIEGSVEIGENCYIGPHVVIKKGSKINEGTIINTQSYIGPKVYIGKNCVLYAQSIVGAPASIESPSELEYLIVIENEVEIGSMVTVELGAKSRTLIKFGAKIDNHCHISHDCEIGKSNFIAGGAAVGAFSKTGDLNFIGGFTLIDKNISTANGCTIAAYSYLQENLDSRGTYGGNPVQLYKDFLKTQITLPQLPKLRSLAKTIEKALKKPEVQI